MAKAKKETGPLIQPSIRVEGEKHILETMSETEIPEMKAVGYAKLTDNHQHNWISYVIKFKGKDVLSIEVDEPNMRAIAEETSKINFTTLFIDTE
jgi:hypothetical protein